MKRIVGKGGRPYAVAEIPFQNARKVGLLEKFWGGCATFHYREVMAISNALNITPRTVRNWKYHKTLPDYRIVFAVIDWVDRGKPIQNVPQSQRSQSSKKYKFL